MKTLNEYLKDIRQNGQAIGHFNFSTEDVLRGIIEATRDAGAPADGQLVEEEQVSEGGRDREGVRRVPANADEHVEHQRRHHGHAVESADVQAKVDRRLRRRGGFGSLHKRRSQRK